jgi:membrane protein required for colicin V production
MNWLDVILFVVLAWSVVAGFRKGFTREAIGLASVVVGLLLAVWFYGTAASYLLPYISSRPAAGFAGFLLVFGGVILLGAVVSAVVRKLLRVTGLSFFDKILGGGFGLVRGGLIGVAFVLGTMAFSSGDKPPSSVVGSRLAPYTIDAARVVVAVAPYDLKQSFRKTYAQVKAAWGAALEHGVPAGNATEKGTNENANRELGDTVAKRQHLPARSDRDPGKGNDRRRVGAQ